MSDTPITILLIEDNPGDARLIQALVSAAGASRFRLQIADRLAKGLAHLATDKYDVVLLDLTLPDSLGLDTLARTQAQAPDLPIIVLTGLDDEALAEQAVRGGAQDFLVKGRVEGDLLLRAIGYAIERKRGEMMLRASEGRLRAILDGTPFPIALVDAEGNNIEFWSHSALVLFGHVAPTAEAWYQLAYPDPDYRRGSGRTLATGSGSGASFLPRGQRRRIQGDLPRWFGTHLRTFRRLRGRQARCHVQ